MTDQLSYYIYGVIVALWCLIGIYATWYIRVGVRRSEKTLQALEEQAPDKKLECLIAKRRLEREKTLMWVEYALLSAGLVAGILLPVPLDSEWVRPLLRPVIPIALVIAHFLLARHSQQTHTHHHELLNKLTAEILKKQLEQKTRQHVKEVAVAEVDDQRIAVAIVDKGDIYEPEHTPNPN